MLRRRDPRDATDCAECVQRGLDVARAIHRLDEALAKPFEPKVKDFLLDMRNLLTSRSAK